MSLRLNRINEVIEHEINRILRTNFREETVYATVVGALMANDFKFVRIKFSVIGDESVSRRMVKFFSKHKYFIRQKLCEAIQLRHMPELKFEITDAVAKGNRMINLLHIIPEVEV
jgi:ribosome-binding factor A